MRILEQVDFDENASTLACEIRSPLNTIKGAVLYLKENHTSDKIVVEFTEIMEAEILRIEKASKKFPCSLIQQSNTDKFEDIKS
jgi:two-component system, NtrC family, nitrogen regulation sensor histidine kinase GlnL